MAVGDNSPLGIKLTIKPFTKADFNLAIKDLQSSADSVPITLKIKIDKEYIQSQINSVFKTISYNGVGGQLKGLNTNEIKKSYQTLGSLEDQIYKQQEQHAKQFSAQLKERIFQEQKIADIVKQQTNLKANTNKSASGLLNTVSSDQSKFSSIDTTKITELQQRMNSAALNTQEFTNAQSELSLEIKKVATEIDRLNKTNTGNTRALDNATQLKNVYTQIGELLRNNSRLANSDTGTKLSDLAIGINSETITDAKEAQNQLAVLRAEAEKLGLTTDTLGGKLKKLFTEHFNTAIAMAGVHALQLALRQVWQSVVDIDTALTELKKVTNETDKTYKTFLENAAATSKSLGATIDDYTQSVADWARLGYKLSDAEELGRVSVMFKNVGDGINSASDAASYLISTLQGFGLVASDAQHVLDAINEVGNNYAVGASGLGKILQRSSAALSAANNTLEETIGLGTAMNTVLQDEEKTGTVLKTVSMYLRSTKTELEDAGESTDGMAESTSKLRDELLALTHGKVNIQLDENTYKSTYQIIKEISGAWKDMTDMEQAAALELMGGKRNANAVSALIQNFSVAEDATKSALDSTGSAAKENEKYLDSIQGRLAQFQSTFQSFSETLVNSDTVKSLVSLGTGFLSAADGATKLIGVLPTLTGLISGIMTMTGKNAGKVNMPTIKKVA